jgi:hypothetical protein
MERHDQDKRVAPNVMLKDGDNLPWRFSSTIDGDLAIEYVVNSCNIQMLVCFGIFLEFAVL